MSITLDTLDRLEHGDSVFALATEAYTPTRVPPGSAGSGPQPSDWDADRAVREGLRVCSTLASVTGRLARKAASVPWRWWTDGGPGNPDVAGEVVPWIEYPDPNRLISRQSMMQESHIDTMIAGESYLGTIWQGLVPSPTRVPLGLKAESPHGVSPSTDTRSQLEGYEWSSESIGGFRYWRAEDIIQIRWMTDPANRWRGLSPLQPLGVEIDTLLQIFKLQLNRTTKPAGAGMIVRDVNAANETTRKIAQDALNRDAGELFGGFMVVGGDQEIVTRQMFDHRQLQLLELMAHLREDIWVAYDLHPALGSSDASTLNNMKEAKRWEWETAVLMNTAYATAFSSRWVPPQKRATMWIGPDYREVKELAQTSEKVQDLKTLVNECRRRPGDAIRFLRLGLPTHPEDEVALVDGNKMTVDAAISQEL